MTNPHGTTGADQRIRYTLTTRGHIALLPRGACGHILCVNRDRCCYLPPAGGAA